jgi:hypothetical protein
VRRERKRKRGSTQRITTNNNTTVQCCCPSHRRSGPHSMLALGPCLPRARARGPRLIFPPPSPHRPRVSRAPRKRSGERGGERKRRPRLCATHVRLCVCVRSACASLFPCFPLLRGAATHQTSKRSEAPKTGDCQHGAPRQTHECRSVPSASLRSDAPPAPTACCCSNRCAATTSLVTGRHHV